LGQRYLTVSITFLSPKEEDLPNDHLYNSLVTEPGGIVNRHETTDSPNGLFFSIPFCFLPRVT